MIRNMELQISTCERSLIIIEEVEKLPSSILNALASFMDYQSQNKKKNQMIYIFIRFVFKLNITY